MESCVVAWLTCVLRLHFPGKLDEKDVPSICNSVLANAKASGLLARRASKVGRTWDMAEGHGNRRIYYEPVIGGAVDVVKGNATSVDEEYMRQKTPEQRERINALHVRTLSKGALNLRSPARAVDEDQVAQEKARDLARRQSRRAEMKTK